MTKDELYELERVVYGNIERIAKEQKEYLKGVEYGIEIMFQAVRKKLNDEVAENE